MVLIRESRCSGVFLAVLGVLLLWAFSVVAHADNPDLNQPVVQFSSLQDAPIAIRQAAYFSEANTRFDPKQFRPNTYQWRSINELELRNDETRHLNLRVLIHNDSESSAPLAFVSHNPNIYTYKIALRESGQADVVVHDIGSKYRFDDRPIDYRKPVYPFELKPNTTYEFFVVTEDSVAEIASMAELWHEQQFWRTIKYGDFWQVLYLGVMLVVAIYSLAISLLMRQPMYYYYLGIVVFSFLFFAGLNGYGDQFLWGNWPWYAQRSFIIPFSCMVICAGWFAAAFLGINRKQSPNSFYALCICTIAIAVIVLTIIVLPYTPFLFLELVQVLFVFVAFIYGFNIKVGLSAWRSGDSVGRLYTLSWAFYIVSILAVIIMQLTLPDQNHYKYLGVSLVQWLHCIETLLLSMVLASRLQRMQRTADQAKAESDAKSAFLARMSHEIRTPMNGILGMAELLKDRLNDKTSRYYNEVICSSAQALLLILNDILDYAKISDGKMKIQARSFSLSALLKEVLAVFELQFKDRGLSLSFDIDKDVPDLVMADSQRLRQILLNLVSNAYKFTETGGAKIHVRRGEQAGVFDFQVSDTGIGIDERDINELFSAFEQGRNRALTDHASTGLGLAICRELIDLMGGSISVKSTLGEGTCFSFNVPMSLGSIDNQDAMCFGNQRRDALRVWVADDNDVNLLVVKAMLGKVGCKVLSFKNGQTLLEQYTQAPDEVELILMDCEMPVMDGFESTRRIRAFEQKHKLQAVPVVALTAHAWPESGKSCIDAGMNDVVLKPVSLSRLQGALNQARVAPLELASDAGKSSHAIS